MKTETLRLLIVDDSALFRMFLRDSLRDVLDLEVVGTAADGTEALARVAELEPDVITLDVEMPGLNGLEVLKGLKQQGCTARVIMVSQHTSHGAQTTTDALLAGAFDYILKPSTTDIAASQLAMRIEMEEVLQAVRHSRHAAGPDADHSDHRDGRESSAPPCDLVLIGASTGGPEALRRLLSDLPGDLAVPVVIVQHMISKYTASLARRLNDVAKLPVAEASQGTLLEPGRVLIAPGGHQMGVVDSGAGLTAQLSDAPPEHGCRPSIDFLFRSVFENIPQVRTLGVILTGMGRDGTEGSALLKDCGGRIIAQHASGCVVYGMPKSIIESGLADSIVRLDHIADAIAAEVSCS